MLKSLTIENYALIDRNGNEEHPLMSKRDVAKVIVDKIEIIKR